MVYISFVVPIIMAIGVLVIRMKATKHPVNRKKIILPPVFMSTGALMFIFPYFRVTPLEILEAVVVGMIFSIFLIKTTHFETREGKIYVTRSKAFAFILVGLLLIRTALKAALSFTIDVGATGGMFWLLAFGMIVPWRIAMLIQYNRLEKSVSQENKIYDSEITNEIEPTV
ncbi:CcdC family protein [Bacillus andreraoultii]|uniref:CcdC family protein n=1 Tax=Bacillus andreraoultii TaxID=1499685 RepID=UPI00053B133D